MLSKLHNLAHNRLYWLTMATMGLIVIVVALFYQYALEELPCVLCIQTRIWISAMILVALAALTLGARWLNVAGHILMVVGSAGLLDRSYQLLGTERGFIFGDCGFDLGLPAWFALDQWLPSVFRVETTCGYTPELILGITMAEGLLVMSCLLLILSLTLTFAAFSGKDH